MFQKGKKKVFNCEGKYVKVKQPLINEKKSSIFKSGDKEKDSLH